MYAPIALEICIFLAIITLGTTLKCYKCEGSKCNAEESKISTCRSEDLCYQTRQRGFEKRGCKKFSSFCGRNNITGISNLLITNNDDVCKACNRNLCNIDDFGMPKRHCYHCSGRKCLARDVDIGICKSTRCYLKILNGIEERGCGSISNRVQGSNNSFYTCMSDHCNSKKKLEEIIRKEKEERIKEEKEEREERMKEEREEREERLREEKEEREERLREREERMREEREEREERSRERE